MKFLVIAAFALLAAVAQARHPILNLECDAVNALGHSHLTYSPETQVVKSFVTGSLFPRILTNPYYVGTTVGDLNKEPVLGSVHMDSPDEAIGSAQVSYLLGFTSAAKPGKNTKLVGILYRNIDRAFIFPVSVPFAAVTCDIEL